MTPRHLPPSLGQSFTLDQARAVGISDESLDRMGLHRPTRSVRSLTPAPDLRARLDELRLVLPEDCAFSHTTAARIWGLPLPTPWERLEPVHVTTRTTTRQPRRHGVVAHSGLDARDSMVLAGWGPVTSPADTWADLASLLAGDDLVVAGDALFYHRRHLTDWHLVERALRHRRRGRLRGAEALSLVRVDAASAMETRTRLMVIRAGLPEPELNAAIVDDDGVFLGFGDLVWREHKVLVEYDGDQHRTDRAQWQRDHQRLRGIRAAGWTVIVLTADDVLRTPDAAVALVRRALGL